MQQIIGQPNRCKSFHLDHGHYLKLLLHRCPGICLRGAVLDYPNLFHINDIHSVSLLRKMDVVSIMVGRFVAEQSV